MKSSEKRERVLKKAAEKRDYRLHVKIREDVADALKKAAEESKLSMGSIVDAALSEALEV